MQNYINPAKITPPVLGEVVHRERLYKIIDQSADASTLYISAPAGYGKTTLVNAYIENRSLFCLWYKVDAGDRDISSFFYHFGMASKKITGIKRNLPLLKPEYQLGIPAFTRHYFRELFARLPHGAVVIFDNYQDAGNDSVLHEIMHEAIQEIPQGYRFIFISREEPPCGFARLNANGEMLKIDSGVLAFTYEESVQAAKLFGIRKKTDVVLLKKIHSCTKGWVTGFKLLLNRKDEIKDIGVDLEVVSQDIVFEYFMGEVLSHIDSETKMFLFKISVLPVITLSLAKKLTGLAHTKKIINNLVLKQFFITRHGRFKPTYEFHPLFHKFLMEQCEDQLTQSELITLYSDAGFLLAEAGFYEDAIELLVNSKNWTVIISLLEKHSSKLIEQGRNKRLVRWFDSLPHEITVNEIWIHYWYGMAMMNYDNDAARNKFIYAYRLAKKKNDVLGLYLSWSGIADSFTFSYNNFTDSISWVKELRWLRKNHSKYPSIEARIRLTISSAMLLMWAEPTSYDYLNSMKQLEVIYKIVPNKILKILCGTHLILDYAIRGEVAKIRRTSNALRKYISSHEVPDFIALYLKTILIASDYLGAEYKLTNKEIDFAHNHFEDFGLDKLSGYVLSHSIYHAESKNDAARVRKLLDAFRQNISDVSDLDIGHYHHHEAIYSMMIDDADRANHHIRLAVDLTVKAHARFPEAASRLMGAYVYAELGQFESATIELDICEKILEVYDSYSGLALALLIRSWIALQNKDHGCGIRDLTKAFGMFYERDIRSLYLWPHKLLNNLCAIALENNIQPEFIKKLIKLHKYTPHNNQCVTECWPYSVKIYTLNRFGVIKDDQSLRLSEKNQQFIKALIAFGGRDVHEQTLSDALWPDAEGDAAHQNFATTLHRIRKAIGSDVLQLRQNRVSLDPNYCWIDIWALRRSFNEIEKSLINNKCSRQKTTQELTDRAISLYQGPFLGTDENEHWMLTVREKLGNQFLSTLNAAAESFCQTKKYQLALNCYQKGLEIDDLSENIYQGLIYCHTQLGNRTEGLILYKQCRERLNTVFGIKPASETEKLYQLLKDS